MSNITFTESFSVQAAKQSRYDHGFVFCFLARLPVSDTDMSHSKLTSPSLIVQHPICVPVSACLVLPWLKHELTPAESSFVWQIRSRGWLKDSELCNQYGEDTMLPRLRFDYDGANLVEFDATADGWSSASHMCGETALKYWFLVKVTQINSKEFAGCPTRAGFLRVQGLGLPWINCALTRHLRSDRVQRHNLFELGFRQGNFNLFKKDCTWTHSKRHQQMWVSGQLRMP